jgi:hypothetical protein
MIIWISGEIMDDVGDGEMMARKLIEPAINNCIKDKDYGKGLVKWYYIAIILDSHGPPYKEITKYYKTKKEVEFRLKIDHEDFLSGNNAKKVWLMSESLLRSIKLMPEIGVKDVGFERLTADVSRCLAEVQAKVVD